MEEGDKYRVYLVGEGEKDTLWRHGGAPKYDLVNQLFEQERTKVYDLWNVFCLNFWKLYTFYGLKF